MRFGVIGGTFNPIHKMHVNIALAAKEQLALDKVMFITAADPPHKKAEGGVSSSQRHKMVKLAVNDIEGFEASSIELKRKGKSYTYYTLCELRKAYPDDEIYFIVGGDSLAYLHEWYRAEDFMKLCIFAVYPRNDDSGEKLKRECQWLFDNYGTKTVILDAQAENVSSTEVRNMIRTGENWQKYIPEKVVCYIEKHNLYKNDTEEKSNG